MNTNQAMPARLAADPGVAARVLVADADGDSRDLYKHYLSAGGYIVEEATDGRDALVKAYTVRPKIVIADVHIPFINGVELCRLLRTDPSMRTLPLVLITADPRLGTPDDTRAGTFDAVLVKPFNLDLMLTRVNALLAAAPDAPAPAIAVQTPAGNSPGIPDLVRAPLKRRRREQFVTRQPSQTPPALRCPICDRLLQYDRSHIGGVGAQTVEQWDYFDCIQCGTFQYRHRTRKLRRVP